MDAIREGEAEDVIPEPVEPEPLRFGDAGFIDAMTALEPERMAELNPEQRARAFTIHEAAQARSRRNGGGE